MSSNQDETAPLLDTQNGATPKQGHEKKCNCANTYNGDLSPRNETEQNKNL